ncbi:hypothetical protein L0657_00995 [Dyadobacter sp. CY345]|uniref:hypothetical protein n=1 Tax=Dyadobacter sp. CY345 TaxID=2909335 RepID=UPI001F3819BB|nr:hypothetical protein [Dyadobacter sp. CY345]MCF2442513.1 hypothetical protein [Dyadobacter sp. CY345]
MHFIVQALFFFILLFVFSSSCKKEKIEPDCGCDGSVYLTIENLQARHSGNGYFVINKTDTNGNLTYGLACDVDSAWEVSTDEKKWNYIISGNMKNRCPSNLDGQYVLMSPGGWIQITSIIKNN